MYLKSPERIQLILFPNFLGMSFEYHTEFYFRDTSALLFDLHDLAEMYFIEIDIILQENIFTSID